MFSQDKWKFSVISSSGMYTHAIITCQEIIESINPLTTKKSYLNNSILTHLKLWGAVLKWVRNSYLFILKPKHCKC